MPRSPWPSSTTLLVGGQVLATALVAASGGLLYGVGRIEGLVGVLVGIAAYRAADDRREDDRLCDRLADLRVADLTATAVELPARSSTPTADIDRICAVGAGLVHTADGPRVLLERELTTMPLARCLTGEWEQLSRPARSIPAHVRLGDLTRLPRHEEVWAVVVGGLPLGVLARDDIERAARRALPTLDPHPRRHLTRWN